MIFYKKLLLIKAALLLFIIILSCNSKKQNPAQQRPTSAPIVDVIIATEKNISNVIEANGTVLAQESVELHPEVTGRLVYLNVPEGAHVSKGTVLARVNDADLQAQLNKSKALLDMYVKTEERLRKLLDINGINQADYDAAVNQVNSTKADIE